MQLTLPAIVLVPVIATMSSAGPVMPSIGTSSLSISDLRAKEYHDETLPADIYKQAEFCSMWSQALPDADQDADADLEGLEEVLKTEVGLS